MRQSDLASAPAAPLEAALPRGTALGRFVVLGLVGRGAMGEVYGAYDPELDRKIAIKLVRARIDSEGGTAAGRTRLMREAQATAKISHPNVVVVYDAGTFGDRVFIAMEFVEGHTLRYWLLERERTWHEVLEAFLEAGRGLAAAHEKELVHRDFKPDNVMVSSTGQVRVMDFGLARIAGGGGTLGSEADLSLPVAPPIGDGSELDLEATPLLGREAVAGPATSMATMTFAFRDKITATGALLGTPAYMSPEQFQGWAADARSDQFSFCVALYEGVYGVRPFSGRTLEELAQNVVEGKLADTASPGRVPAWVRKTLERGLRANPNERFPTMQALLAEIAKAPGAGRGGFASGASAKLAGIWESPVEGHSVRTPEKDAIRQAFLGTEMPYAAAAFTSASAILDRFAQRWADLYVEVCEATHVRGEQSAEVLDLRMAVLNDGLDDLKALCRLFRGASVDVVANAVKAASALGTLERCQDIKLLRAIVRPPEDAVTRAYVEQLRSGLVEVRALSRVGRLSDALEAIAPLVEKARSVGYGPVLAEILLVLATDQYESARIDAALVTFEEAFSAAELSRHEEVAVEAAIWMSTIAGYRQARFDLGNVWARYAETLLRRMGGHDLLWGVYFGSRAASLELEGRLAEAVECSHLAIAKIEKALGSDSPELAGPYGNLANHKAFGDDFAGALEASRRAISYLEPSLGVDHPRTALFLGNSGQYLYRLGRFDEAIAAAKSALATFERTTNPRGFLVTLPLRTLGLCYLATSRWEEALAVLEQATAIREALEEMPLRLAEVHFALARAVDEARGERARAIGLARRARREYSRAAVTPIIVKDIAELDRWLGTHPAPPAGSVGAPHGRPFNRRAFRGSRRPSTK